MVPHWAPFPQLVVRLILILIRADMEEWMHMREDMLQHVPKLKLGSPRNYELYQEPDCIQTA